jgi:hypothetical protein
MSIFVVMSIFGAELRSSMHTESRLGSAWQFGFLSVMLPCSSTVQQYATPQFGAVG